MIDFSTLKEENAQNNHMKSLKLDEQDHQDLLKLNTKQGETVQEYTNDDLKTELQQFFCTNMNDILFDELVYRNQQIDNSCTLQQENIAEEFKQDQEDESQFEKIHYNKYQNLPSQSFKLKDSVFQKDVQSQNQNEQRPKMDTLTLKEEIQGIKSTKNPKKLIRAINLLVNVKTFYRQITRNTRVLGKLTKYQHYLINDVVSIFQTHKRQKTYQFFKFLPRLKKILQTFIRAVNYMIKIIPMFQPYSLYKFLWDIFQAMLIVSVMFLFSLINFFQMDPKYYVFFFQAVFVLFVLDMLFTFNTGVVEKGNVIFDRKKAAITYLKKNFIMDQIALLPLFMFLLDIQLQGLYSWAIYFQILMKLFVLSDIFNRLTYYLNYQKNMKNIVDLVKLVFIIACVCHVFCLFWHGLAIYEIKQGCNNTWLQVRGIQDANVFTRYVQSFYYLSVTMITVGYGDITPQTTYEILFTTITMFVTGFFYAFSLNKIGSIIENIEMKDKSYKESMQVIHRLMREESVSQTLRVQISNYLQYLYKESNEVCKQQEKEIINKLSKQLKYGLIQDVQGKYLKEIEFIDKLESKSKIVEIMEECLFSPGEYIFQQGDVDDSALYYIVKGSVKITYEYQDRNQTQSLVVTQLHKSQYFGDMQFIQGSARILTAQASDFCRTYKIRRDQFFNCIKQSEQDFENFQMLKEAYIFKENQKLFKLKCYTCNKSDHISIKCPKTHLTFSKLTLIQKESKTNPHLERKNIKRRQQKFNSLTYNFDIINAIFSILEQDENQYDLQNLEEQINYSQDEAYLEQQLLEFEALEYMAQIPQEQNKVINQIISEVDQDQEQENLETNDFSLEQTNPEIEKIQPTINLSKPKKHSLINRQRDLSLDKIQSYSGQKEFQYKLQNNDEQQQFSVFEQKSSLSNLTQRSQKKHKQQNSLKSFNEEIQNIESQMLNLHQNSQLSNLNNEKKSQSQLIDNAKAKKSIQNNKLFQEIKVANQNLEPREYNNKNNKPQQDAQITIDTAICNQIISTQPLFKRKSQSLYNFDVESKDEQNLRVKQKTNYDQPQLNDKNNEQKTEDHKSIFQLQIMKSQSFDEASLSQLDYKLKHQKTSQMYKNNQNDQQNTPPFLFDIKNQQSPKIQDEKFNTNNSTNSNLELSKQNLNYTSQSTIKSVSKSQSMSKNEICSQQMVQKQQQLNRRQSKKITLIRQMQSHNRRISQLIFQEALQNQSQNNQNAHNIFTQIAHQMNNSPLIAKRRSNVFNKNLFMLYPQEQNISKNQNSLIFESIENSKLLPEILKNRSSLLQDINSKDNLRKRIAFKRFYCQMIENTIMQEEYGFNIHMNSVQFNKQDHQELIYLNMKQSETVKEQTNDDLKTEIQNNLFTNQNDQQFFNTDQEMNDEQISQLQQISVIEKSIYGQDQSSQIDNNDQSKIYIAQIQNYSQCKDSKLSRISIELDQKQIKSKFETQKSQYEGRKSKRNIKNPKKLIRAINLLPYNIYKFIWDILQAILILSVMFLFSLITFFQMDPSYYINFFQAVFVVFVLDMLFTFNTGVVEKGNVIFDRKKAAVTYLKKNFIMDQIALLPLFMFILDIKLQGLYSWAIYFQILMKLFVLSDIFNRLTYYLNYQKNMKNIVDLVKLVFIIACVCHVFCLFWHGLAIYEIKQGCNNTWLQVRGIQDANVFTRYVQSFYYLSVTMITVGYGDITPQTTYEILFTTVTMFVTGFFYAFSLNRIGSIIENIEMKDKSYKESMQVIHRLMREENVSQTLRVQISNYLQYLYKESNEVGKQQEKQIIDKLSKQLKYGLIQDVQGKYLKEIEFIDKLQSKSKIVEIMEECLFSPGEYIFQQGDLDDSALYYIVKGSVKITYEYQDRNQTQSLVVTQLHKSQYFGDMQFIQGSARILTAQASDFCRTYKIPREQFFNCIKESEQDFENFQMLKEAYIFKENQKLFKIKCYTCNKTDHISIKCPKTHLTFSKQTLIQKSNKSNPHLERKNMQRRQQKYNSLSFNLETIDSVFQFLEKEENLEDLQQIEEQMNLSQDEAYLEQQLIELQQLEYNEQQIEEQKNYEIDNERIIEVGQDEEQDNDERSQQKNNFGNNKKSIQISIHQNDQQTNQEDETEYFDDLKSVQSNYSIKGIINQFQKNKQKKQSVDKNQSRGSVLEHLNQQYNMSEQFFQSTEQNSSISNITQKSNSKLKQINSSTKNVNEENENQERFVQVINPNNEQQILSYEKIKQKILKPVSYCEIKSQKNLLKMQLIQENREKNNSTVSSKEAICRNLNKNDHKDSILKNQQNFTEQKKSIFKRKSQSLTNLQDESDSEQEQVEQKSENRNTLTPNYQMKRKQSQSQKKHSIRNSISQQFIRSQSYDEKSFSQVLLQLEQKKSIIKNVPSIRDTVNTQDEIQISNNNTSISNINFSKQNINYNSQSTIKSITNYEPSNNKDTASSMQKSQQDLMRRQSKKMTLIRQQKQQKRASQIIHPILQQAQLNHNQNIPIKSQNKNINQINQQYSIQQNQEQLQNLIRKRKSLAQSQIQQIYNNQNQIMYQYILQQMNNSPLIAKRRSSIYAKNMIAINQQELNKNKNQSSTAIDNLESSKLLPEIIKNRSSLQCEMHNKENNKKLSQLPLKVDINKYFQNNSNENNHLSQLYINYQNQNNFLNQENEIQALQQDSSYKMLQIFDKANIFRFYYPNYNINQVVENLNSKESQQFNKKAFKKQATRRFLQTKRTLNYLSVNNKVNERVFRYNVSKDLDFNKSQI
ncbi:hypothetical protein ABPG74_007534 [Tetrahymena malaccensis]